MKSTNHVILITGGATGIGLALAEAFLRENNTVIICGRREDRLAEAKAKFPNLHTRVCDVSQAQDREELSSWLNEEFPNLNILINNAGIQQMLSFAGEPIALADIERELTTNVTAPIHLTTLLLPLLRQQSEAAILNVSSGLAFTPLAAVPVYCATKAALHSFTLSLRYQLRDTSVNVFEIVPPIVNTELGGSGRDERGQQDRGIPPVDVADATLAGLQADQFEILIGMAQNLYNQREKLFPMLNR
ncbi:SDR family oxidoreductase [Spirosoma flavum]|uniref:SDR family oxidoreductase n=1 Tax=Spirosoma flavum TaxID=2048557 RepID=A0ABW6AMW2_9BACT